MNNIVKKMEGSKIFGLTFIYLLNSIHLTHTEHQEAGPGTCSIDDSMCLTAKGQNVLQEFMQGVPKLNIKSLKEIILEPIKIQLPDLTLEYTDIKAKGLENAVVDDVSIDIALKTMRVFLHTNLRLECNYEIGGMVFSVMQVFGKGKAEITLQNMQLEMLLLFDFVKNDDGKYIMDFKTYYYGIDPVDGVQFYFDNLYNGDKAKGDVINNLLNKNWRTVMANFDEYFNRKITDKIFDAAKAYKRSHPLENLPV